MKNPTTQAELIRKDDLTQKVLQTPTVQLGMDALVTNEVIDQLLSLKFPLPYEDLGNASQKAFPRKETHLERVRFIRASAGKGFSLLAAQILSELYPTKE